MRRLVLLVVCLFTLVGVAAAQTVPVNGNLVVTGTQNLCVVASGSANTYACNLGTTVTYKPWVRFSFVPNVDNTGASTVAFNGQAAKSIMKLISGTKTAVVAGDLRANTAVDMYYDGTDMVLFTATGGPGGTGGPAQLFLASQQAGADNCAKIQAGIDAAVAVGGGKVIGDFTGAYTCSGGFTVKQGTSVELMPSVITVGATVVVNEYAHLIGHSTSSNTGATTIIKAATNLNANVILLQSSSGASQWWHGGELAWLRVDGNGANQSAPASCVKVSQPGENSDFHSVLVTQCGTWGIEMTGIASGSSRFRQISVFSTLANGAIFLNGMTSSVALETVHVGGAIGAALYCKAGSGGFNVALQGTFQIEGFFPSVSGASIPAVVFDETTSVCNITGEVIQASQIDTTVSPRDMFQRINGAGATLPYFHFDSIAAGSYTNLYRDTITGFTIPVSSVSFTGRVAQFGMNIEAAAVGPAIALYPFTMNLVNGLNNNVPMRCRPAGGNGPACTHALITGPTAAFTITGLIGFPTTNGAVDGQLAILENRTSQVLTLANQNINSATANQILSGTGSDFTVMPGTTVNLMYNVAAQAWYIQRTAVNVSTDVNGILPVVNGGTGTGATLSGLLLGGPTITALPGTTVGTVPVVTGANTFAFGAVDVGNPSAVTGILPLANGGHGLTPSGDDQVFISSSSTAGAWKTLPDCAPPGQALNYATATNAWSCNTLSLGAQGSSGQVQWNNAGAIAGTSGLTVSSTAMTGWEQRTTTLSTSATLTASDGPIIGCNATAGVVTATLPTLATAGLGHWRLVKTDSSGNACTLAANAADQMHGVAGGSKSALTQWSYVEVEQLSSTQWSATAGQTIMDVASGGTGATTLTGLVLGNGTSPMTGVTTSADIAGAITDETGSGALVFGTSPTIVTPTVASFTNATHNHTNAAGGGQLTDAALSAAVTVAKGGTGLTAGTSGGVPYFNATSTMASSAALTANLPVIGGGAGNAPTSGTRTGNTTAFATATGTVTGTTNCAQWDTNGNLTAAAASCGTGGGGAITSGTANGAVYATGTTTATSTGAMAGGQVMVGTATGTAPALTALGPISPQTTGFTVTNTQFHTYTTFTVASGTFTITLPASASQPAAGTYIRVLNYGSGTVTIARNNTNLNGGTASLVLRGASATNPKDAIIFSDGTNYFANANPSLNPVSTPLTDSTTLAINSDNGDLLTLATMATAGTYTVQTDTGAPVDGQKLTIRLTSSASRTVAWSSGVAKSYRGGTMPCPTATSGGGLTDYVGLIYNGSATRWDCVSFASGY